MPSFHILKCICNINRSVHVMVKSEWVLYILVEAFCGSFFFVGQTIPVIFLPHSAFFVSELKGMLWYLF